MRTGLMRLGTGGARESIGHFDRLGKAPKNMPAGSKAPKAAQDKMVVLHAQVAGVPVAWVVGCRVWLPRRANLQALLLF